jgi:hypothetical protein
LLQLQRNWFACNWRKVRDDAEYGRWPSIRDPFARQYGRFLSFCESHDIGNVDVEQTEVTYVNHIEPGSSWDTLAHIDRVFKIVGTPNRELFPHDPEQTVMRLSYRIHNSAIRGGRLHVSIEPGLRVQDMRPLIVLTLTARTLPLGSELDKVLSSIGSGREWIVHEQWERYE